MDRIDRGVLHDGVVCAAAGARMAAEERRDISLLMFLLFSFGVACWLAYGIGMHEVPIIAANAITLALALVILVLKIRFDRSESDGDETK